MFQIRHQQGMGTRPTACFDYGVETVFQCSSLFYPINCSLLQSGHCHPVLPGDPVQSKNSSRQGILDEPGSRVGFGVTALFQPSSKSFCSVHSPKPTMSKRFPSAFSSAASMASMSRGLTKSKLVIRPLKYTMFDVSSPILSASFLGTASFP